MTEKRTVKKKRITTDKQRRIVRVSGIRDVCAFRPERTEIREDLYTLVPADRIADMEAVVLLARERYNELVNAEKKKNTGRFNSLGLKNEAMETTIHAFLDNLGITYRKTPVKKVRKVVRSEEKPNVLEDTLKADALAQKLAGIEEVKENPIDKEEAKKFYDNNFPDELLDSLPDKEIEIDNDFDTGDDFDFDAVDSSGFDMLGEVDASLFEDDDFF